MVINQFNLIEGISIFNESNLIAGFHTHPALEIIIAKNGDCFTLSTKNVVLKNIQFGIVKANIHHSLNAENCDCDIIMMDAEYLDSAKLLNSFGQKNDNSEIFSIDNNSKKIISNDSLLEFCNEKNQSKLDDRIINCLQFIKKNITAKEIPLVDLSKEVNLSQSRLSHLFKEQIGVSIQNYIVWTRMKIAVNYMINNKMHLTDAAYHAGFYDSAHFSRHFKKMFGVKPSLVYNNSIIVQGFEKE